MEEQLSQVSYDPYKHRQTEKPTNNFETLVHIIQGLFGTGILAMPHAFANAGWINSIISTIMICALVVYCLNLLIKGRNILCKRYKYPFLSFPESMKIAFRDGPHCMQWLSNPSSYIINIFISVYQIGTCCVFVLFIAENVEQVMEHYVADLDLKVWILACSVPIIFLSLIRSLKSLAPISIFGNIFSLLGIILVMYYLVTNLPDLGDRRTFSKIEDYPLFLGFIFFATDSFGVAVVTESNMKTPKSFLGPYGVLSIAMAIYALLLIIIGFCGYWRYGDESKGSITLNIPPDEPLALAIRFITTLSVGLSYPLELFVPVEILWTQFLKKRNNYPNHDLLFEYLIRLAIVLFSVPRLGWFMTLLGSFCLPILALLLPALMDICVYWLDGYGRYKWILIKDILISIAGLLVIICGTYQCIRDLMKPCRGCKKDEDLRL